MKRIKATFNNLQTTLDIFRGAKAAPFLMALI